MLPTITLFTKSISTYYLVMLLGYCAMGALMHRRRGRYGLSAWQAASFTTALMVSGVLGCKVLGVNTQTKHPVEAMMLAEYLTSEQAQLRRFEVLGYGPSNINAAASPAVAADPALTALAEQSQFAISQHVLGQYWTPAEAFGAELEAHSTADLQQMLDQLVEQATAK